MFLTFLDLKLFLFILVKTGPYLTTGSKTKTSVYGPFE